MQIVCVVGVNDGHVAAGESVLMDVLLMLGSYIHRDSQAVSCAGRNTVGSLLTEYSYRPSFRALRLSEARWTVHTLPMFLHRELSPSR